MKSLILALASVAFAAGAGAEEPTAVLSSESDYYRQALAGFTEAWGSTVPVVSLGARLPPQAWAFAAVGSKAAARAWPRNSVVVACLSPSASADAEDEITHVSLLADPAVVVDRMLGLAPRLKVLRAFWSSESSRADMEALQKAGAARGVVVLSERVDPPRALPEKLRSLEGKSDVLWLMPDPALVNAENFSILREYAAAEKIPFFAPTEGLAARGATATIAATFRDMGRAAAGALRERLAARSAPEVVYVSRVTVTVNLAAARAAGLGPNFIGVDKVLP